MNTGKIHNEIGMVSGKVLLSHNLVPVSKPVFPLSADFPLNKSTPGFSGTVTDDPINGLTMVSTSGTEIARMIKARSIPSGWTQIEFGGTTDNKPDQWRSNGFVLMGAAGNFINISVGNAGSATTFSALLIDWDANGNYIKDIAPYVTVSQRKAFFRLNHSGTTISVEYSKDQVSWANIGTINETADLGGPALFIGPSANLNTTTYVTFYSEV